MCRDSRLTDYVKSFGQLYLLKTVCKLEDGLLRFCSEFFREGLHRHCSAAFLKNTSNDKNSNSPL
jgi:hypothetical protein